MNKTKAINILKKQIKELENITPYKMGKVVKDYPTDDFIFESIEVIDDNGNKSMYCKLNLNEKDNKEGIESYNYRKTKEEALQTFIDSENKYSDKDLKNAIARGNNKQKTIKKAEEMLNEMRK